MRRLQLEYGAEIGRAVVNFDGPIVFCVISRFHGGAFVVFSRRLNDNFQSIALERAHASVIGGAPAAAVVFARDVNTRTRKDPRIAELDEKISGAEGAERERLRAEREERWADVRSEKLGELAGEFDAIHSVERAVEVGSVDRIISAAELRPQLIEAVERGMQQTLDGLAAGNGGRFRRSPARAHLGEPERVARRVVEARVDAVGALLGLLGELDAARLELLVVRAHVVGGEEERAGEALGGEVEDLLARLVVEHRLAGDGHQHDGEVGWLGGADGEPAEVAHLGHGDVGADLPAQLLGVEGERLVLVVNPHL